MREESQKFKHRSTIWSDKSTCRYIPKRTETCSQKLLNECLSSIIHDSQKVESQMSMGKQNVVLSFWTMEYYSAMKRNKVLIKE